MADISIIFEDEHILLVNKPAGLGTQAPREFDSMEARVRAYLAERADPDRTPYLGIPHRLDRCASGAMVFAKRKKAAQRLSKQFERREVQKSYLARVAGTIEPNSGEWRDYLRKIPEEPRGEVSEEGVADAKLAVLRYEVIEESAAELAETREASSLLKIELETGRMHQIRIQCASRGLPVWGDVMYGSEHPFGPVVVHERDRQIALHAAMLGFNHPRTRDDMTFEASVPATWD